MEEKFMKEAIRQAHKAAAIGDVPIGCVIVKDGTIIDDSNPYSPEKPYQETPLPEGRFQYNLFYVIPYVTSAAFPSAQKGRASISRTSSLEGRPSGNDRVWSGSLMSGR